MYDGVLGDTPGTPHKGMDYVLREEDGSYRTFDVYTMHDGMAFQGVSESWGGFVALYKTMGEKRYATIYAHLSMIDESIPPYYLEENDERIENEEGVVLLAGQKIGITGTTGWTNDIVQLHLELHEKDLKTNITKKLDPYGLNDRASSGRYPQPGESLQGLEHGWIQNMPNLIENAQ